MHAPLNAPVVVATQNPGKLAELQALLAPLGVRLRRLAEFTAEAPEETGAGFVENALIKARHAARLTGLPAIADDSGLEVAGLDGAPGVHSARYAGPGATDAANNARLLAALAGRGPEDPGRAARFVAVLVAVRHAADPVPLIGHGFWPGRIALAPSGEEGFGYDPLFVPAGETRTAAAMPPEEKRARSHRGRAVAGLIAEWQAQWGEAAWTDAGTR